MAQGHISRGTGIFRAGVRLDAGPVRADKRYRKNRIFFRYINSGSNAVYFCIRLVAGYDDNRDKFAAYNFGCYRGTAGRIFYPGGPEEKGKS